jgi:hypothetical protein
MTSLVDQTDLKRHFKLSVPNNAPGMMGVLDWQNPESCVLKPSFLAGEFE